MLGNKNKNVSEKTVGRLSVYRRTLSRLHKEDGTDNTYSHVLAAMAGVTPAQFRRDIMAIGYTGSPTRGYKVESLLQQIDSFLNAGCHQHVALVGAGNLGRAVMAYLVGRRPSLEIVAAFDKDPHKHGRVIAGCRTYNITELATIFSEQEISIGIIAVPGLAAQVVTDDMAAAGATGILNFAPVSLRVPPSVYVENIDLMQALEKVAYFAQQSTSGQ
ncbi:MAG: redox-sensing transcriptional repressor Rex [Lentisphaeria bacterium]